MGEAKTTLADLADLVEAEGSAEKHVIPETLELVKQELMGVIKGRGQGVDLKDELKTASRLCKARSRLY